MHSSYNYSGFVDLYTSLARRQAARPRTDAAKPAGESVTAEPCSRPPQPAGAVYRQRLRLVPR
jgi:hypothetical protein